MGSDARNGPAAPAKFRHAEIGRRIQALSVSRRGPDWKPRSTQRSNKCRGDRRLTVDPLERELADATPPDGLRERHRAPRGACRSVPPRRPLTDGIRALGERDQPAPSTLHVEHGPIGDAHQIGAGHPRGTALLTLAFGPRQGGSVGLGGVGGRDHPGASPRCSAPSGFARSRSTAPGSANWAPPIPSMK